MRVFAVAVAIAVAGLGLSAGSAHAAAPRIVIFSGKPIARQVVISDWPAIFRVFEQVAPARVAPRSALAGRPRLQISMFWGPRWIDYLAEGKRASTLRPGQADQHGSFYPAWRGRAALIELSWAGPPRVVPVKALVVLKRFGVPIRLR